MPTETEITAVAEMELKALLTELSEGELIALELEVVEDAIKDPIFQVSDCQVEVSSATEEELLSLRSQLEQTGLAPDKSDGFIKGLAKRFGGKYADVLGFRPIPPGESNPDLSSIDMLFGRVHMPTVKGFTTKLTIEREQEKETDISIKINGFGAGGSKSFACKISQSQTISAIPVNLVIPVSVKIDRFENSAGDYFYICYPVNISRNVVARRTKNQYDSEDGYKELSKLPGILDRYDTTVLSEPQPVSEVTVQTLPPVDRCVKSASSAAEPLGLSYTPGSWIKSPLFRRRAGDHGERPELYRRGDLRHRPNGVDVRGPESF